MINIQDLSFSYKKKPLLEKLDLQFEAGHIYGLLGKNGTGKSTLLRNIAGLLSPKKGSIKVNGHIPFERVPGFLEDIFIVLEEFHLPDISISDLIKYYAPFYPKFDSNKFTNYIAAFEVPSEHTLQKMSYGEKKKVLISFGVATNTRVLLMDEPTNGLDITSKSQFRKVLADAVGEERCIIISTHQVKDLENLIDRITILDGGKILFDENVEDISSKLSFRFAYDDTDLADAYYSESSYSGNVVVTKNTGEEESKLDLELLYKAIVTNSAKITQLFKH